MSRVKKVVVIGPESTGKSTLSKALAAALGTVWVPEYARAYLEWIGRPYNEHDLVDIARGQLGSEDELIVSAEDFLICDTDLNVIKVWSEHSFGRCHTWILEQIALRKYDAYLLTDIDFPWVDDPMREHGEASMRHYFFQQYLDIVMNTGVPWKKISGSEEERLSTALSFVADI